MSGTTWSGTYSSLQVLSQPDENPFTLTGTISVTNQFALYGLSGPGVAWSITNAGLIESQDDSAARGILVGVDTSVGSGTVVNTSTGIIIAGGTAGNAIQFNSNPGTVVNYGLINASSYGVLNASFVYNKPSATIVGEVGVRLAAGSMTNAGTIEATGTYGNAIFLAAAGTVINQYTGPGIGTAVITASGIGINLTDGGGTVANYGQITAGAYGIDFATAVINQQGGTIVGGKGGLNLSNATVTNAGSIGSTGSGSTGVLLKSGGDVFNQDGTVDGTITGGQIIGEGYGIKISGGAGTIVNAGTIGGADDAVAFSGSYTNRLIVDPSAMFVGNVDGGAGSSSVLELAAGSGGTGTLHGLGSTYVNFAQITIDAGATWMLVGTNNTIGAGVTLDNGAGITLAAGATLDLAGTVASGATIVFGGSGVELVVQSTASMAGAITGFGTGDTIDLRGVAPGSVSYADGSLNYTPEGGGSASIPLALSDIGGVRPSGDGAGGTDVTPLCFCTGTRLATPGGEIAVEQLGVGDTVLTAGGTARRIVWIGVGCVLASRGRRGAATPVIVRKSALADNVPYRDLHVTKGHALWFDGVLIPVEFLVNHRSILWDDRAQEVSLYHIELDRHDVLLANGAPAESYRDDGNRWLFRNRNSGWGLPALPPCAPVLTGGPVVDAVWRRLLDRAGPRPGLPVTSDPDLHLLVDGVRVDASWQSDNMHLFRLGARPGCVRVMSRSGVPQELGMARDPRPLGVAVRRVVLRQAARLAILEAEDPRLTHGFHSFEADNGWRWTTGDAHLPEEILAGFDHAVELELHLGGTTSYQFMPLAA